MPAATTAKVALPPAATVCDSGAVVIVGATAGGGELPVTLSRAAWLRTVSSTLLTSSAYQPASPAFTLQRDSVGAFAP